MAISVRCDSCGSKLNAPDAAAGRRVKCPKCGAAVVLPAAPPAAQPGAATEPWYRAAADSPSSGSELAAADGGARAEAGAAGSHIARNLMPGEQLVYVTRIHPLVVVPPAILSGGGLLVALMGFLVGGQAVAFEAAGVLTFVLAAVVVLVRWVERLTTEYACTDQRIYIKSGVLTTRLREMPLAKVEALLLEQTLFGRLFGYGTLVFKGSGGTRRTCEHIENPVGFHRRVQEQVALAQGAGERSRAEPGAAADRRGG